MSRKANQDRARSGKVRSAQPHVNAVRLQVGGERAAEHGRTLIALVPLALLTLLAAIVHVAGQSQRPLWLDEAGTYWISQGRAADLLRGIRTDGTPPLYYLLIAAITRTLGSSEIALRFPSLLAATALVPAVYALTRLFAARRAAFIAAGLAAISPLVHYYSVEARCYALLQLMTVAIVYLVLRAVAAPDRWRWWTLLSLAQAIQLWTHGYAVFLVPVPALVCLLVGGRARVAVAARAAAASACAFVLYLPWFFSALSNVGAGVGDWIGKFWAETPPYAAVFRSLEVFGFGGLYPSHLGSLGEVPSLRLVSVPLTIGLLALAVLPWAERRNGGARSAKVALLVFLFVPLLGSWLYSLFRQPLYLVGRYDTIVLPVFLIVLALGLDKILRKLPLVGGAVAVVLVAFATASYVAAMRTTVFPDHEDLLAAQHLARDAAPADPIVSTGYRRLVVAYYLERAGRQAELSSFPPEMAQHPGWYSAERILRDPDRVAKAGEDLAQSLVSTARQGRAVWVLTSPAPEVNMYLYRPLLSALVLDEARSRQDCGLFCLRAK